MTKFIGRSVLLFIIAIFHHYGLSLEADSENKDLETVLNDLGLTKYLNLLKQANLHELLHPRGN